MPAPKKVWIHDGRVAEYPSVLTSGSVHRGQSCTACHGGDDAQNARADAHVGSFEAITGASNCAPCHNTTISNAAGGLHTTLAGYDVIMARRGFNAMDPTSMQRFEEQCSTCHVANDDVPVETACGHCHVSVPATAGGGLLAGHAFQATPSMDKNCTACHGSRIKDEYTGANNALLGRNKDHLTTGLPWKDAAYSLEPDVHYSAGMECVACHGADEMHGVGAPMGGDRYDVSTAPSCDTTGCHDSLPSSTFHSSAHFDAMSCQVCHAQPYKNCFECHTDVTAEDLAFFTISASEPGGENDHLMTFRVGKNPDYTMGGTEKEYVLLRHVPVDADTFAYTGANQQGGLLPQMGSVPTWKYTSPHNIRRVTAIQSACGNCHGQDFAKFWLTDAVANGEGWISTSNQADETSANSGIVVTSPIALPPDSNQ